MVEVCIISFNVHVCFKTAGNITESEEVNSIIFEICSLGTASLPILGLINQSAT